MASLDDLLAQLGVAPPPAADRYAPIYNAPPTIPQPVGEAMGLPFPMSYMDGEMEMSAPATMEEPALDETVPLGAQLLGYSPQPRPDLAAALTQGPTSDLFSTYRNVYSPPQAAPNPMSAMRPMGRQAPAQSMLRAQPPMGIGSANPLMTAPPRITQEDRRQQILNAPPTESERILMRRSPEYARPIAGRRKLDAMRLTRGY